MKKLYADEELNISKENFEKPENLSIVVDCDQENVDEKSEGQEKEIDEITDNLNF